MSKQHLDRAEIGEWIAAQHASLLNHSEDAAVTVAVRDEDRSGTPVAAKCQFSRNPDGAD
jgi:hypothetical protein